MKTNVEKVLERDQKLSELDDRAGEHPRRREFGLYRRAATFEVDPLGRVRKIDSSARSAINSHVLSALNYLSRRIIYRPVLSTEKETVKLRR